MGEAGVCACVCARLCYGVNLVVAQRQSARAAIDHPPRRLECGCEWRLCYIIIIIIIGASNETTTDEQRFMFIKRALALRIIFLGNKK